MAYNGKATFSELFEMVMSQFCINNSLACVIQLFGCVVFQAHVQCRTPTLHPQRAFLDLRSSPFFILYHWKNIYLVIIEIELACLHVYASPHKGSNIVYIHPQKGNGQHLDWSKYNNTGTRKRSIRQIPRNGRKPPGTTQKMRKIISKE